MGDYDNIISPAQAIKTISIQEHFFFLGQVFSFEDYFLFSEGETKTIITDPTGFEPLGAGVQTRIPFNPLVANSTAGPILIDFYVGADSDDDGEVLGTSNRDSTNPKLISDIILRLNPSNIVKGTRFAGDLIAANATGPGNNTLIGSQNVLSLPFAISNLTKYAIDLTNVNGDGVYVQIKLTWLEILG